MRVIYNGIDLTAQETHAFDATPVFDAVSGTDYLYTRYLISLRAVVNGQAQVLAGPPANGPALTAAFGTTDTGSGVGGPVRGVVPPGVTPPGGGTPGVPGAEPGAPAVGPATRVAPNAPGPGRPAGSGFEAGVTGLSGGNTNRLRQIVVTPTPPATTHRTLRHRLTTPRGQLFVFAGGWPGPAGTAEVILQAPDFGFRCDCKNGPVPLAFNVVQALGDATTFIVDFAVECFVNESPDNGVSAPGVLLSNRFSQSQAVDDNGFTSVATVGEAVFRTDYVYRLPESPDAKRPVLFMPVPQGFVRSVPEVTGLPDGTGVRYQYVDRQVPVNFTAGPYVKAASISAVHRQAIVSNHDILEGALTAYERILGQASNRSIARGDQRRPVRTAKPPAQPGEAGSAIHTPGG